MIRKLSGFSPLILAAVVWLFGLPLVLGTKSTQQIDGFSIVVYVGLLAAIVAAMVFKSKRGDHGE